MNDNMIERVARAINDRTSGRIFARAAIEAMREPTGEMMRLGQRATKDECGNMSEYAGVANWQIDAAWTAMIDAALQEKPE